MQYHTARQHASTSARQHTAQSTKHNAHSTQYTAHTSTAHSSTAQSTQHTAHIVGVELSSPFVFVFNNVSFSLGSYLPFLRPRVILPKWLIPLICCISATTDCARRLPCATALILRWNVWRRGEERRRGEEEKRRRGEEEKRRRGEEEKRRGNGEGQKVIVCEWEFTCLVHMLQHTCNNIQHIYNTQYTTRER